MKSYTYSFLLLLTIVFSSCYKAAVAELPNDVLPLDKMAALLIDVHLAEGYLSSINENATKDSLAGVYYASILAVHNLDTTTFNYNMDSYMRNPAKLAEVYSIVLSKIDTINTQLPKSPNN